MPIELASLADLDRLPFDEIIDVRSPAEFAEDHIPGALNLPVLDNAERAHVGRIYVQEDPFRARKIGAALLARNAAAHLEGPLADRPGGWRPLVYCWRGGQRSGAFATILREVGWRVETLAGGYKSFRRLVVARLYDEALPLRPVLVDGMTGTAKTRLLHHLQRAGAQILDLEALAAHRGSLFGGTTEPQPSQKAFETRLAFALGGIDPARPVFLEAESSRIGRVTIPPALWKAMRAAPRVMIEAPLAARVSHLLQSYGDLVADPRRIGPILERLRRFHGREKVDAWRAMAEAGDFETLAAELVGLHYDARYARPSDARPLEILRLERLDDATLADAAGHLMEAVGKRITPAGKPGPAAAGQGGGASAPASR